MIGNVVGEKNVLGTGVRGKSSQQWEWLHLSLTTVLVVVATGTKQ